ncbi:MAG: hypothetical protein KDD94_08405, partial [Calditrichaeota bacterium]|nr:hypothetical protein [Calditrichota bacterium]
MLYTLLFTVFLQTDVYIKTLNKMAKEPLQFVSEKLIEYDLLIFDDALHSAAEPWDFYNQLIETDGDQIDLVFIEVLSVDAQSAIDRYTQEKDSKKEILAPAFQDTFNGMGFTYQTVLDFLTSVKSYNQNHQKKIRVIAVDVPVFWA